MTRACAKRSPKKVSAVVYILNILGRGMIKTSKRFDFSGVIYVRALFTFCGNTVRWRMRAAKNYHAKI